MEKKAQASFEMLFIALIVLSGAFALTSFYFIEADSLGSQSIARAEYSRVFSELAEQRGIYCSLDSMNYSGSGAGADLIIYVYPPNNSECKTICSSNSSEIERMIEENTSLVAINISCS